MLDHDIKGSQSDQLLPYDNIVSLFWDAVHSAGDRVALTDGERSLTYSQYGRAVAALSARLVEQGAAGTCVAVCMQNSIEAYVAIFAVMTAGAQVAMFNPMYSKAELHPLMECSRPKAMLLLKDSDSMGKLVAEEFGVGVVITLGEGDFIVEALAEAVSPPPTLRVDAESLATLHFTGGTTGRPKGVDRTHRSLMTCIQGMYTTWPTRLGEEIWLNVAPLSHVWGFNMGCINAVYAQATTVLIPRFHPDRTLDAMVRNKVSVFSGGPASIYVGVMAAAGFSDADLGALRLCPGGGSPFLMETLISWEKATGVPIVEGYGMTETGAITVNPIDGTHRYGTVGRPLQQIDLEVVSLDDPERPIALGETGEIRVRGPSVINSYRDEPPGRPDGWLYTGDVGFLDDDGYLTLVDRKKDMLIVNGYNVYPRELEEVLSRYRGVVDVAVVGVRDPRKGEVPVAFVVPRNASQLSIDELTKFCVEQLAPYKRPVEILFIDNIPKTPANKNCRRSLSEIAMIHLNIK